MDKKGWFAFAVVVLLAILVAGWLFWWRPIDRQLTERPKRVADSEPIPPSISSVQVSAVIPYAALSEAVTGVMPQDMSDQGRQNVCVDLNETVKQSVQSVVGGDVGKLLGEVTKVITQVVTVNQVRHVCQDVDYRVAIHRDGPATASIAPSGNGVRVSLPISISGEVGFSGDVAKALALDRKSFRGSIITFADIAADLGTDWCPTVQVTPDFVWTDKAQLEVAGKVWINIDGTTGPKLKDALRDAAQKIPQSMNCEQFKSAITPLWHPYSWPINDGKHVLAYVNLTPQTVGFSGLSYQPDAIRAAIAIGAATDVTTDPDPNVSKALSIPPLQRIDAASDKITILLPLRANYDELDAAMITLLGTQEFIGDSPAGKARVRIKEINLYPAGKRLVLGMKFSAKFERRTADVNGWVYVVAEPWLDEATQTLRLKNVAFTRDLDNKLWAILSAVFRGPIQNALEEKASVDLRERVKALRVLAKNNLGIAAGKQGIRVELNDTFVGLKRINLAEKNLEVLVGFEGTADVAVARVIEAKR
jgi:uncharacterized protein DUF4403